MSTNRQVVLRTLFLISIFALTSVILPQSPFDEIVNETREAFEKRDFNEIETAFYFQTFLSIEQSYAGYYGAAQVVKIMNEFLNDFDFYSFKITAKSKGKDLGYISGKIYYSEYGRHKTKDIFITLKKENGIWQITQITVN